MKILFINLPYHGHVVPTIGLVQELIKRGCEVTYIMPFGWEEKVAESGASFYGYDNHKKLSEQIKNAYHVADNIISLLLLQRALCLFSEINGLQEHLQRILLKIFP